MQIQSLVTSLRRTQRSKTKLLLPSKSSSSRFSARPGSIRRLRSALRSRRSPTPLSSASTASASGKSSRTSFALSDGTSAFGSSTCSGRSRRRTSNALDPFGNTQV
ncbi:hypothetical protein RJT34_02400 [Clitoria ternatea]|uniref:Uncharacterized protein n=1 Tax=Clitoria ternatea TaxID=43366 RepID=A0AAN9KIJ9_CLITE